MKWVWATHPEMPNKDMHARGRRIHIATNNKTTLCNMLVVETADVFHVEGRKKCKNCLKLIDSRRKP